MNMKWVNKRKMAYWKLAYKYLSEKEYHETIGNECNIPKCCIDYFVNFPKNNVAFNTTLKYGKPKIQKLDRMGHIYVMCPKCREEVGTIKLEYYQVEAMYNGY